MRIGGSIKERQKEKQKKKVGEAGAGEWERKSSGSNFIFYRNKMGAIRPFKGSKSGHISITQALIFPCLPVVFIPALSPLAEVRNLPVREIKRETEGLREASQSGSTDQSWKHTLSAVRGWIWFMTFITQSSMAIWVWLVLVQGKKKHKEYSKVYRLEWKHFSIYYGLW